MPTQLDDVVVTRAVSNRQRRSPSASPSPAQKSTRQKEDVTAPAGSRNIIVIAVLLGVFSLLLLLALASYSTRDAANAEMSFREIVGVLRGNAEVSARIDTTQNWLGLLGAVIANMLYNGTFGVCAISIPLILGWWSRELFLTHVIARKTLERSGLTLLAGVIASGFFGTLQLITWLPTLPREWSGASGSFLAITLTRFTGTIGSFFITGLGLFFAVAYVTETDLVSLYHRSRELGSRLADYVRSLRRTSDVVSEDEEQETESVDEEEVVEPMEEERPTRSRRMKSSDKERMTEPARFLRKNLQPDNTLPLFDAEPTIIRPDRRDEQPPVTAIDPSEDVDAMAAAGRPSLQRGSDGLIDGIPGAPPPVGSAHDTSDDDAEFLEDETSDDDAVVPSSAERPRPAKLHLQVEEGHFDDEVHPVEQPDIYDEHISYVPPGMDLLDKYPAEHLADDDELKANALTLKDKLDTFKIKIEDVTVTPGPVITQYEFVPADGVKISRIESLSDDIALALKAKGIRIIAPVPGKGTVGVEIPNHNPSVVHFSSIITSKTFNDNDKQLPIALGKTIIGETFSTDLAKLPHLLIAGSTGSGKSVGVNAILMSLIYKVHPRDLKFVIIDPKKVEMTLYAGLKHHFLAASPDVDESIV
ncbi:MAG: DNA translocase FtsK 4TM domain-containing protein, partial [Candidatus Kapaibacterium sp.]